MTKRLAPRRRTSAQRKPKNSPPDARAGTPNPRELGEGLPWTHPEVLTRRTDLVWSAFHVWDTYAANVGRSPEAAEQHMLAVDVSRVLRAVAVALELRDKSALSKFAKSGLGYTDGLAMDRLRRGESVMLPAKRILDGERDEVWECLHDSYADKGRPLGRPYFARILANTLEHHASAGRPAEELATHFLLAVTFPSGRPVAEGLDVDYDRDLPKVTRALGKQLRNGTTDGERLVVAGLRALGMTRTTADNFYNRHAK